MLPHDNAITKTCKYCGDSYTVPYARRHAKYCKPSCYHLSRRNLPVDQGDGTAAIHLTHSDVAIIDASDIALVSQYAWSTSGSITTGYYVHGRVSGKIAYLHRFLAGAPGLQVDHIDGNPLNNRRSNLRVSTASQNGMNKGKAPGNTSGYKGVTWDATNRKWRAKIKANRRDYHIGRFDTAKEAAKAYDERAKKLHGAFARLNFPDKS